MVSTITTTPVEQQSTTTMPTPPPMVFSHLHPRWPPLLLLQPLKPASHHQPMVLFHLLSCSHPSPPSLFIAYCDIVWHLFDGWVADACQLCDDTGWVTVVTFVCTFNWRFYSGATRSKNLTHAQQNPHERHKHHPAFHDSAFPKRKLGWEFLVVRKVLVVVPI